MTTCVLHKVIFHSATNSAFLNYLSWALCILFHIRCCNAEFGTVMMTCLSWIPMLAFPIVLKCTVPYLCAIAVSELREFQSIFLRALCILSKSAFPKLKKKCLRCFSSWVEHPPDHFKSNNTLITRFEMLLIFNFNLS